MGRLLYFLSRLLGFSGLPKRSVRDRDSQHRDRNNCPKNACQFFRIHFEVPVVSRAILSKAGSQVPPKALLRRGLVLDERRHDVLLRRCDGLVRRRHMRPGVNIRELK